MDSNVDDELAIDEDAAVPAAAGGFIAGDDATAGAEGDGELMGVGFGLSSSDAANLSLEPSEATTRKP